MSIKVQGITVIDDGRNIINGIGASFTGIVTASQLSGFAHLAAPHGSTETITVKVITKTSAHRYDGSGSSSGYTLNGIESPLLTLTPGRTYKFDQADNSNSGHPFRFYLESNKTTSYTTNITTNGTAGNVGSYTEITVTDETPIVLHYQCSAHSLMGNAVQTNSNKVSTPYSIIGLDGANITGIVTATSFSGSGASLTDIPNGALTNSSIAIGGVTLNLGDTDATPAFNLSDATAYPYTSLTGITTEILGDTTPQLGGNLDFNSKFITGTGGINVTGVVTATSFSGSAVGLTSLTDVSSGTYGDASNVAQIVVDANGRITGISEVTISGGGGGGGDTVSITSNAADILSVSSGAISADDAGADKIVFWDDSQSKLTYLNVGSNLSISGTTLSGTGGGGSGSSTTRSVDRYVATASQTLFPPSGSLSYSVGYIDVYLNGGKLDSTEFTATNGTNITLTTGASANDIVELIAYNNLNLVDVTVANDTTPTLGGDLDLNGNDITGTGNINITGTATVTGGKVATQNDAIAFAIALG